MLEIERKFLVSSDAFKAEATSKTRIVQGFLSSHPERTVRVRIKGETGFLTIKGKSTANGTTRFEWEHDISLDEAQALLKLCEKDIIDKIRYEIPVGKHLFEVDVFSGENQGLTVAEVELHSENEAFEKPDWLDREVTGDNRYYNSQLSKIPFSKWRK